MMFTRYWIGAMVGKHILGKSFRNLEEARQVFEELKPLVDPHGSVTEIRLYDPLCIEEALDKYDGEGIKPND